MSQDEKFDLRDRIILYGNQGVNREYLKHQLGIYLSQSKEDFQMIEEKPKSSWSMRELRLLAGRNILREVYTHLEETNDNKLVCSFPLYLFSIWYNEARKHSSFGEHKGISLIPYVRFKHREDILMSTLCRKALCRNWTPQSGFGELLVNWVDGLGSYILSDDLYDWVYDTLADIKIPERKKLFHHFGHQAFGSFYLFADCELLSILHEELGELYGETLSSFKDKTTDGLRLEYEADGDFDKDSGCLEWKVKEDSSVKGKYGPRVSELLKRWIGLGSDPTKMGCYYSFQSSFSNWLTANVALFDPFSFDEHMYREKLKFWL